MTTHIIKPTDKEETQVLRWLQSACESPKKYRPNNALKGLRVENGVTVGTDGHRLHIAPTPESLEDYQDKTLIPESKITITPKPQEFTEDEDKYPDWKVIMDQIDNKEVVLKIGMNKKYLADLANMPGDDLVILTFTDPKQPVKITKQDNESMAVIMPMFIRGLEDK